MKKREYKLYVDDILQSMDKIFQYTEGMEYEQFIANDIVVDATIRNLEIIGEAARNIPDTVRAKHPEIPWKRMLGLRNIVIHEYFGIDLSIVWEIVTKNLTETKPKIVAMRSSMEPGK